MSLLKYPTEEFLKDCKVLLPKHIGGSDAFYAKLAEVFAYMERKYHNSEDARYLATRFMLIMEYLARHVDEFDHEDFLVKGSQEEVGALVGGHVLRATHQLFVEDDARKDDPTPDEVMRLARQLRDAV